MKKQKNYNRRYEKDYGLIRTIWYRYIILFLVYVVSTIWYNIKIEGRENIPKTSRIIYAGNHTSFLDPPMISLATNKAIAYMAKQELFYDNSHPVLKFLVHSLGAFAVNREKPEIATFKTVKSIFNTTWSLGIFPQGRIVEEPEIKTVHKGFAMFAKKFQADIVPVAVCGFDGYAKKMFEKHMTIKIGKPISYTLSEDEIVNNWVEQICSMTGFENKTVEEIQQVNA